MNGFIGFEKGMGIGGWLTNYKRFNVLPPERRMLLTVGDFEHFDTYITESDVKYIASLGMDHIRLGFDQIVVEESAYVYREHIFGLIENFIKWCRKYSLNAVLNLHKAVGNYCDIPETRQLLDDDELQERFTALWREFEKRFCGYPEVAFELLNEVRDVDPKKWNTLAEKTVDEIRKLNTDRKIILGSVCWNSADTLESLNIFDDENIIYTFHYYLPFSFTHQQGVLQADPLFYNRKMPYPGDAELYRDYERVVYGNNDSYKEFSVIDRRFIRSMLLPALKFRENHPDKILWCGEFGTIRHCNIKYRENWMRDVISVLKEFDIPYCVWNYLSTPNDGNRFSLVDDDERKILSEDMARIIRGAAD